MATANDTIPDLTDSQVAFIFRDFDSNLNPTILFAFLHGLYTCIISVAGWKILVSKYQGSKRNMSIVIGILYVMATISLAFSWSFTRYAFIKNGETFWTVYQALINRSRSLVTARVGMTVTSCIGTIFADATLIWRCYVLWGRRWVTVVPPSILLVCTIVFKIMETQAKLHDEFAHTPWLMIYVSFAMATAIWCTVLITYRLLTSPREKDGSEDGPSLYHRTVELFVESGILYAVGLILYVVFVARTEWTHYYLEPVAEITGAVAPTLLLGRILTGFARPYDSWKGSVPATKEKPQAPPNQISSATRTVLFADEVRAPAAAPAPVPVENQTQTEKSETEQAENAPAVPAVAEKSG
ncbi:hypothetical protein ARMGADRAFT_1011349 [Armillaria gallica]|uniref:Family A G protein-coupled receptor-like protein n=1 Tax=Armillaria gallica TaxID=47427 RepID=A0A2H3DJW1_ARMGA|nr:hypothetical protein ARMGADRAFT_1011349 [Armillaria gallica]